MSDLLGAKARMNWKVTEALMSQPIFDPADLDEEPPVSLPVSFAFADDQLALDDVPALAWEVIL